MMQVSAPPGASLTSPSQIDEAGAHPAQIRVAVDDEKAVVPHSVARRGPFAQEVPGGNKPVPADFLPRRTPIRPDKSRTLFTETCGKDEFVTRILVQFL